MNGKEEIAEDFSNKSVGKLDQGSGRAGHENVPPTELPIYIQEGNEGAKCWHIRRSDNIRVSHVKILSSSIIFLGFMNHVSIFFVISYSSLKDVDILRQAQQLLRELPKRAMLKVSENVLRY